MHLEPGLQDIIDRVETDSGFCRSEVVFQDQLHGGRPGEGKVVVLHTDDFFMIDHIVRRFTRVLPALVSVSAAIAIRPFFLTTTTVDIISLPDYFWPDGTVLAFMVSSMPRMNFAY